MGDEIERIAVTGGAGFLGSHVVDYLSSNGDDVVVVDDFSSGDRKNLEHSREEIEIREVDLTEIPPTKRALSDVDIVVHLAAKIGGIGYFHEVPADILSLNDAINRSVLEAVLTENLDRIVYASSSMVYERADEFPVSEAMVDEIPPPDSAYGFQKLAGERYCKAYHDQYGVDYTIFRPFNAVGPREPPGDEVGQAHVIPDFVKKIVELEQYPLSILGDGSQMRAFTNVEDIARGVYACVHSDAARNDDFNLGSEDAITMRELAAKIWRYCDRDREIKFETEEQFEHDVQKRIPDSSKAERILDWTPEISLDESLEEYIDWYRKEVI